MISAMVLVGDAVMRLQHLNGAFVVRVTKGRDSKAVYQLPGEMKRAQEWVEQHFETDFGRAAGTAALSYFDEVRWAHDKGAR